VLHKAAPCSTKREEVCQRDALAHTPFEPIVLGHATRTAATSQCPSHVCALVLGSSRLGPRPQAPRFRACVRWTRDARAIDAASESPLMCLPLTTIEPPQRSALALNGAKASDAGRERLPRCEPQRSSDLELVLVLGERRHRLLEALALARGGDDLHDLGVGEGVGHHRLPVVEDHLGEGLAAGVLPQE